VIDESEDMPSIGAYRSRFGSLLRAYQLIGYSPGRDYDYVEMNRLLRSMHQRVLNDAVEGIEGAGGHVSIDGVTDLLTLNGEFTTSVVIARCFSMPTGARRWKVRISAAQCRNDASNQGVRRASLRVCSCATVRAYVGGPLRILNCSRLSLRSQAASAGPASPSGRRAVRR
jgi:hypothetical protein